MPAPPTTLLAVLPKRTRLAVNYLMDHLEIAVSLDKRILNDGPAIDVLREAVATYLLQCKPSDPKRGKPRRGVRA